jgi:hypothetical protein
MFGLPVCEQLVPPPMPPLPTASSHAGAASDDAGRLHLGGVEEP